MLIDAASNAACARASATAAESFADPPRYDNRITSRVRHRRDRDPTTQHVDIVDVGRIYRPPQPRTASDRASSASVCNVIGSLTESSQNVLPGIGLITTDAVATKPAERMPTYPPASSTADTSCNERDQGDRRRRLATPGLFMSPSVSRAWADRRRRLISHRTAIPTPEKRTNGHTGCHRYLEVTSVTGGGDSSLLDDRSRVR